MNILSRFPNVAAVTTLFVVLLGSGSAEAESHNRLHEKTHNSIIVNKNYVKQRNAKTITDKKSKNLSIRKLISHVIPSKFVNYSAVGIASWYGYESGKITASGDRFNPLALTAAHKFLPLSSRLRVTNLKNNKSIVVTVNDRGPHIKGRLIDLSLKSARLLDISGLAKVQIQTVN